MYIDKGGGDPILQIRSILFKSFYPYILLKY